jgi:hypothetical protein
MACIDSNNIYLIIDQILVMCFTRSCFLSRSLLVEHRENLLEQLRQETEPAMGLHLAAVILFQYHTGCMIHVPGKCVPHIITCLADYMPPDDHTKLTHYQGLVVKQLTGNEVMEETVDDGGKNVEVLLAEGLNEIKDIALSNKKAGNIVQNGDRTKKEKS